MCFVPGSIIPEGTPLYGLYRYICSPMAKEYSFSAVLVILNRLWFLYSSLDMHIFLRGRDFFIIIKKKINKSTSQITVYGNLTLVQTRELIIMQV